MGRLACRMESWVRRNVASPLKRVWKLALGRICRNRRGTGLKHLYEEVRSCAYEDVHVMWSILHGHNSLPPECSTEPLRSRFQRLQKAPADVENCRNYSNNGVIFTV